MRPIELLSLYTKIVLIGVASARVAAATQPLEEFVTRSREASFDNQEQEATARQREAEAGAALGRILPVLSARGVYTRNQYESAITLPMGGPHVVITPKNQLDGFLQVDVPLFDAANYYRWKSSRASARAAREQRGAAQLDVTRSVARYYFQFLGASALVDSAKNSVEAAESNLKNVTARHESGAATELDQSRAVANVERARQDVADAELATQLAARSLETLSGLSPTAPVPFAGDDLHEEAPLERWALLAGETPAERAAREQTEAAKAAKKSASLALLPTVSGMAQEHFTNATGFTGRDKFYTLQAVATWRLDYTTLKTSEAQAAAADVAQVREARSRRNVSDAIFEAYRRVQNGIVKSRSARAQAGAAKKAAETQLDVTEAQRDAFLAEASRIQADADLAFARASLRLAAGRSPSDQRKP
jgi:outer membrane protein TolC